jgi:hypothetical protein
MRSANVRANGQTDRGWNAVTSPPEPYDFALVLFADGKVRRAIWNGRIWWGYDEVTQRSGEVQPVAWRKPNESEP